MLPRGWHWRVDQVLTSDLQIQLLTAYNSTIEEFLSWLTCDRAEAHVMIAQLDTTVTIPAGIAMWGAAI